MPSRDAKGRFTKKRTIAQRFWSKVRSPDFWEEDGLEGSTCWIWEGYCCKQGYGRFYWPHPQRKSPLRLSHRAAYALHIGRDLDPKETLMHTCDVRACVNPAHLKLGSQKENVQDMIEKGRASWQNMKEEDLLW